MKSLKMPRGETGYSSDQHVSFILVSLGRNRKRDIGLLGTEGLISWIGSGRF